MSRRVEKYKNTDKNVYINKWDNANKTNAKQSIHMDNNQTMHIQPKAKRIITRCKNEFSFFFIVF